jgi:hypothetical protein
MAAGYNTAMSQKAPYLADGDIHALLTASGATTLQPGGQLATGLTLKLPFFEHRALVRRRSGSLGDVHLVFEGGLPEGPAAGRLTPQPPGLRGRIKARGEQLLGVPAADDVWIVHTDDDGWPLLRALAPLLAELAAAGATTTETSLEFLPRALVAVLPAAAIGPLPGLWERTISFRLGH